MSLLKFFIVLLLLVSSSQSLALFMPAGAQANIDAAVVSNEVGC